MPFDSICFKSFGFLALFGLNLDTFANGNRPTRKSMLLCLLTLLAIGCGASEDPAAVSRLKAANVTVMQNGGKSYQIIVSQELTDELAGDVAKLGHLKNLNFSNAKLSDAAFVKAVNGLEPISVVLNKTPITDEGVKGMSGFSRIEAIFLTNTEVTSEALKTIGKLNSLLELNIDNTKVTDDGLAQLTGLSNLKVLVINNTSIGDAGLDHLKSMKNLSKIDAKNTQITPAGVKALQSAIPGLLIAQ